MIDFTNQSTMHYFIMMHSYTFTNFDSLILLAILWRIFFMLLSFSYG